MSKFYEKNTTKERVLGLATALKAATEGASAQARMDIKEAAISTSDFPSLFNYVNKVRLDEEFALAAEEQIWQKVARRVVLPDFKRHSTFELGWDDSAMDDLLAKNGGFPTIPGALPNIPEGTEYPSAFKLYESEEDMATRKNGARVPVTFETIVNDQWDVIGQLPSVLARAARKGEDAAITHQLATPTGLNTTNFNATKGTLLKYGTNTDGTAELTRETLKAALTQAANFMAGPNKNRPVIYNKFVVMIPRALKQRAADIESMPTLSEVTSGNRTWMETFSYGEDFEFVINPQLDTWNEATGRTAWYVLPYADAGTRPALALAFLERFEQPELRVHSQGGLLLNGGEAAPELGSFLNDTWEMRIRHIYDGAAREEMFGSVASIGTETPAEA